MRILTLALAAVFVLSNSAIAQNKTHTVRSGQTLSEIASKYGVSQAALLRANKLSNAHKLKLGQKLSIPKASKALNAKSSKNGTKKSARISGGGYTVRNGDYDGSIAKKLGISVSKLHELNPGVNWKQLQIGQALRTNGAKSSTPAKVASKTAKVTAKGTYTVKSGDNDWIIARRVGTTPSKLRQVNPNVKWTKLQIGQTIRVPGGGSSSGGWSVAGYSRIMTRHAVIAKDDVVIRRKPSTIAENITTVPKGTYVTVLDRESGWYKLKFPKGTVGWVRGDLLKPLAPKYVARATPKSRRSNYATVTPKNIPYSATSSLALLDRAFSMIGVRYRYGASSRHATDCSGFTLQVYRSQGIKLPRTSREQSRVGTAVSKSSLKPGDLVFFHTRSSRRVNHAGIYVGGGKFIHASSGKGRVRTDSLSDGYYSARYSGARRVTKNLKPGKHAAMLASKTPEKDTADKEAIVSKAETSPAVIEPKEAAPKTVGTDEIIR